MRICLKKQKGAQELSGLNVLEQIKVFSFITVHKSKVTVHTLGSQPYFIGSQQKSQHGEDVHMGNECVHSASSAIMLLCIHIFVHMGHNKPTQHCFAAKAQDCMVQERQAELAEAFTCMHTTHQMSFTNGS